MQTCKICCQSNNLEEILIALNAYNVKEENLKINELKFQLSMIE